MKSKKNLLPFLLAAALPLCSSQATTLYWDGGSTTVNSASDNPATTGQNWLSGGNWDNGSTSAPVASWTSGDSAIFGGTAATQTITAATLTVGDLTFGQGAQGTGTSGTNYTVNGGTITLGTGPGSGSTVTTHTHTNIGSTLAGGPLTKSGLGTLTLNGSAVNPFTGGLNVNGGTLALDYANLATPTDLINSSNALAMGGGKLYVKGKDGSATSQTLGNVTVNAGGSQILVDPGTTSTTLNLGTLTANTVGGSLLIGKSAGAGAGALTITSTGDKDTTGIYGGRIAYTLDGGTTVNWATTASVSSPYTLSTYTGYAALTLTAGTDTGNSRITGSQTLGGARTTNTLKIENPSSLQSLGIGSNQLTLTGGGLLATGTNSFSIGGTAGGTRLTAGNGSGAYNLVVQQYNTGGLTIAAVIGDNSGNPVSLTKTGPGTLTLTGTNTYTGGTTLQQGSLIVSGAVAAPTMLGTGTLTLSGGTIAFTQTVNTFNPSFSIPIFVTPDTTTTISLNDIFSRNYSFTGNITGSGTLAVTGLGSGGNTHFLGIQGDISGFSGTFTYDGSGGGTINKGLNFNNPTSGYTYDGSNAKFSLNATGGTGGAMAVAGNNLAAANTDTFKMGELSGTANTTVRTVGANINTVDLIVGYLNTDSTFAGVLTNGGTGASTLTFTKTGTGTLTLSGANTYTGATAVSGGTLLVNGSLVAGSAVSATAGTLGGSGTIGGTVTVNSGATLAPGSTDGNSTDTLTTGAITLNGTYQCQLDGANCDKLASTGSLTLSGATLAISTISAPTADSYVIATYTGTVPSFTTVTGLPAGYSVDTATSGQIKLVASDPVYTTWAARITDVNLRGKGQDSDGDGFTNLQEFMFGKNPNVRDGSLTTTERTSDGLVIHWSERTGGALSYTLMESATLANPWNPWVQGVAPYIIANDGAQDDQSPYGIYQPKKATVPLGSSKGFFRVEAVGNL